MRKNRILAIGIWLVVITLGIPRPVYAITPHEDPDQATQIFSGMALLLYYSDSLEPVLEKNPEATQTILAKIPFVNIPRELEQPTADLAANGMALSQSISDLFSLWEEEKGVIAQYRLADAGPLDKQIAAGLPPARDRLARLKAAVQETGRFLKIDSLAPGNELKRVYAEVMDKIKRLEEMLVLLSRPLVTESATDLLKPASLTLEVNPPEAFVGEAVNFSGTLTSRGEPLGEREIELLLNSSPYLTLRTDAGGNYRGQLQIPERYAPEMPVQMIFYPQGSDRGRYLGSSSPAVKLAVLYYAADLVIQADNPAYPGLKTAIRGKFNYSQAAPLDRKQADLYLDETFITEFTAGETFTREIPLDPGLELGRHTVVVSVPASGRYAPVQAACTVEIARSAPVLDLKTPKIAFLPGSLGLSGSLHSAIGPLQGAALEIETGGQRTRGISAADGTFQTQIILPLGWSLLGSQTITIQVQPQEPWNAPLKITRTLFMLNFVSCGLLLVILAALSLYLPRRFKKWLGAYPGRGPAPAAVVRPAPSPVYPENWAAAASPGPAETAGSPEAIFSGYRGVLKWVQSLTGRLLKPQQTLREYTRESSLKLGPVSQYFWEFTLLIERLLYSRQPPTGEDIEKSRQLSQNIRKEAKGENL